jgi:hypothetical protein
MKAAIENSSVVDALQPFQVLPAVRSLWGPLRSAETRRFWQSAGNRILRRKE